jgi:hypothetical protein
MVFSRWATVSPLSSARRLATGLARRAGLYLSRYPLSILYDEHIARMLAAHEVNCVLDVGAQGGEFGAQLRRIGYHGPIVSYEPVAETLARRLVHVRRLDEVMGEELAGIAEPRVFLKVDTKGYDRDVIRGLGDKIASIVAIQVQMSMHPSYDQMTNSCTDFLYELQSLGFVTSAMFPVTYAADGVSLLEFDCLLSRDVSIS